MDVSFSANTWKVTEIQNIDPKLQEQFYASTSYNLNDFKNTAKPPTPIFKHYQSNESQQNNCIKKQLISNQNVSLSIFITYLYEFLHQVVVQIQKKSNNAESKTKLPLQSYINVQKGQNQRDEEAQSNRRMVQPQKHHKTQEFQLLKCFKLKIYELDLCKLRNIPQKFTKYYNNNLLKKIIFQYLSKALQNISLVEILLQSNEVLCFALSLVSQSLLFKKNKVTEYNQERNLYEEALTFLEHFDPINLEQTSTPIKSLNVPPSSNISKKTKTSEEEIKTLNFANFLLIPKEMKSKHASLKEQKGKDGAKIFVLYLLSDKPTSSTKISSQASLQIPLSNQLKKKVSSQSSKRSIKQLGPISDKKLKEPKTQPGWMQYLGCFRYFFRDSPKK